MRVAFAHSQLLSKICGSGSILSESVSLLQGGEINSEQISFCKVYSRLFRSTNNLHPCP